MFEYKKATSRFLKDKSGATAVEYGMFAMFMAVAGVGAIGALGTSVNPQKIALLSERLTGSSANSATSNTLQANQQPAIDPIQTGSTTAPAAEAQVAESEVAEPAKEILPQIYISSQASPSCTTSTHNAGCRPTLSVEAIEGWKDTLTD